MSSNINNFKLTFFDLPSREFGETYVEPILRNKLGDLKNNDGNKYDAVRDGKRVEYKAVRVVFTPNSKKDTLFDSVMSHAYMSSRIGTIKDIEDGKIVANCQNIKIDEFDILVYVLVDDDGFHIFEITVENFKTFTEKKNLPNWCSNHGSKEKGKNGQFHIKSTNVKWHKEHCFREMIPWSEILKISKNIKLQIQKKDKC